MTVLSQLPEEEQDFTVETLVLMQLALAELQDAVDLFGRIVDDDITLEEAAKEADRLAGKHRMDDGKLPTNKVAEL